MTHQNDPNRRFPMAREDARYTIWVLTGVALLVIAGVMVFAVSTHDDTQTRPTATVPASPPTTTGSNANTDRN